MVRKFIADYCKNFVDLLNSVRVTDKKGRELNICDAVENICTLIKKQSAKGGKVIFIGNGGNAAISSHMAIDFWKNGKIKSTAFNDSSLLTCISNDFGYEHVFEKPIEFFAEKNDILFAISSSGKSENILKGINAAKSKECNIITLSGFDKNNPLCSMGEYNFYVPSNKYGPVEVAHQYICHLILDAIISDGS